MYMYTQLALTTDAPPVVAPSVDVRKADTFLGVLPHRASNKVHHIGHRNRPDFKHNGAMRAFVEA